MPGQPSLPVQGAMLGIPQGYPTHYPLAINLKQPFPGSHVLCQTPRTCSYASPPNGQLQFTGYTYDHALPFQQGIFSPATIAELVDNRLFARSALAEACFNPLQYEPGQRRSALIIAAYKLAQVQLRRQTVSCPTGTS